MLVSGESCAECGGTRTFAGDGLLPFVVESFAFEEILVVDVAPVMASRATLAEGLVHARLGLGSVLDYGTRSERTFGASHDGKSVGTGGSIGVGLYSSQVIIQMAASASPCDLSRVDQRFQNSAGF